MTLGQLSRQSQDPPLAAAPAPTSSPGAADNGYTLDTAASSHLLTRALAQHPAGHLLVVGAA